MSWLRFGALITYPVRRCACCANNSNKTTLYPLTIPPIETATLRAWSRIHRAPTDIPRLCNHITFCGLCSRWHKKSRCCWCVIAFRAHRKTSPIIRYHTFKTLENLCRIHHNCPAFANAQRKGWLCRATNSVCNIVATHQTTPPRQTRIDPGGNSGQGRRDLRYAWRFAFM